MKRVWTVGHSTRTIDELVDVLKSYEIEVLVDVRTVPRSRTNPQFNKDELEQAIPKAGIEYVHAKDLGGLRKPVKDSSNMGWRNEGFRGYADYVQTPGFDQAMARLIGLAERKRTAVMCAETLPWRCHRSILADALLAQGFDVTDIFDAGKSQPHKMTPFAVVVNGKPTYPEPESPQQDLHEP